MSCMSMGLSKTTKIAHAAGIVSFAAALVLSVLHSSALAGPRDRDGDRMPDRWEVAHDLNPKAANAAGDPDRDGLTNLGEYRNDAEPKDEDSDNDGADDGDEVKAFETEPDDRDSDDDGSRDGDEDADNDSIDNEDEDDSTEPCRADDDDRDSDGIDDEDENESGTRVDDVDSNDDGVTDGNEDLDADGIDEEDEDDDADDRCEAEEDGEDLDDLIAHVVSFTADTGELVAELLSGEVITGTVTADTELEWESIRGEEPEGDPTLADLVPDRGLSEIEFDDESGALEKVKLIGPEMVLGERVDKAAWPFTGGAFYVILAASIGLIWAAGAYVGRRLSKAS